MASTTVIPHIIHKGTIATHAHLTSIPAIPAGTLITHTHLISTTITHSGCTATLVQHLGTSRVIKHVIQTSILTTLLHHSVTLEIPQVIHSGINIIPHILNSIILGIPHSSSRPINHNGILVILHIIPSGIQVITHMLQTNTTLITLMQQTGIPLAPHPIHLARIIPRNIRRKLRMRTTHKITVQPRGRTQT